MFLKLYAIALPLLIAFDALWLGVITRQFYAKHIGSLLRPDINWAAAAIFYALFVGGLVYFVVQPAVEGGSWVSAALAGALFGFIAYMTYDLTNLATLKGWTVLVTVVDIAWGTFVVGAVSAIATAIGRMFS